MEVDTNVPQEVLMKRLIIVAVFLGIALNLPAQDFEVTIRRMTPEGLSSNQKFPLIAENADGEKLYIYRGSDRKSHYYYKKDGDWTSGGIIPGSPTYDDYWFSDIVVDSTGAFHYVSEDADAALYYGYFQDGAWAAMRKVLIRHEATLGLAVRSDDTIVLGSAFKTQSPKGVTKDVIIGFKPKLAATFANFMNITRDHESSTMVDVAVDSKDNSWVVYKGGFVQGNTETMQAVLVVLDKANKEIYWKNVSGEPYPAFCWYPTIALNAEGQAMVSWMMSQKRYYFSRFYDPATEKWAEVTQITTGPLRPWPTMYNKVISAGSDFYWVGVDTDRMVMLYKYDPEDNTWTYLAKLSSVAANWCSAYVNAENLYVSWDAIAQPTVCYLTTVSNIFPPPPIKVQSVSNLVVERKFERSFFSGYHFNVLTWEANPVNTEEGIIISAHHVYRRERTADATQWTQISVLAADVYTFQDNNVPAGSDYVYAVTCVDSNANESPIEEPTGQASKTTPLPRPKSPSIPSPVDK